jgi:hypothetical protein
LKIFDIYENKINSVRMLCIITELMEGGELFDKILKKIEDKETFTERGGLKFNKYKEVFLIYF